MVEPPDDFSDEEMKVFSSHPTNATHLAFEDSPKSFDVVRVDVASNILTSVMIYEAMDISVLGDAAVHLEAVGVNRRTTRNVLTDHPADKTDIKFLRFHEYKDFAGIARKQADDGQFIRSMALLGLDASNV